jgi:hypothetical protein
MDRFKIENGKVSKKLKEKKKKLMARKIALEKEYVYLPVTHEICTNKARRKDLRIACRSRAVARVIVQNYRADTGDDAHVPVYCVSNRMYMRHLRGYDYDNADSIPTMSIEETQIPALCSLLNFCPGSFHQILDADATQCDPDVVQHDHPGESQALDRYCRSRSGGIAFPIPLYASSMR